MQELWINNIKIDIKQKAVSQTLQVNDLAELKDRQTSYASLAAAMSTKNIEAMNYLGLTGSQSRIPYEKPVAKYVVEGIELISAGFAVVRETGDQYIFNIYSGNISMFELIKDKTLPEMDWTDHNHHLNASVWNDSMSNTEGYIYAVGAFGTGATASPITIERQAPSLFFHSIWHKIFTDAGFTYSGDFFTNNTSFKSELLPMSKGYTPDNSTEGVTSLGTASGGNIDFDETGMPTVTQYEQAFTMSGGLTQIVNNVSYLTVNFDGVLRMTLNASYTQQYGTGQILFKKNGSVFASEDITATGSMTQIVINASVNIGDTIQVILKGTSEEIAEGEPTQAIDLSSTCSIAFSEITGGMFMDFSIMLGDIKQSEFIKDVMQRYGLMFQSVGSNHYEFIQMETLLNDRAGSENWSDKLSHLGKENYKIGSYGQNNFASYQYEEDIVPSHDGFFTVTNENIRRDHDIFTSIFRISEKHSIQLLATDLFVIPIWNTVPENLEDVPRIFKLKTIAGGVTGHFFDPANNATTSTTAVLSLDEVHMDYYINNYYPAFNRILNAPKKRGDFFYLSNIDVYNLDFFKLKRIDQLGQYFYLNKVSGFKSEKVTKCELIQVNGLTFNQPPDQLGVRDVYISHGGFTNLSLFHFTDTVPPYSDPEFDAPETVKIISFGSTEVEIRNNGIPITADTIVQANDINLSIHDDGTLNDAHTAEIQFKIQSINSTGYSESIGKLNVIVSEYVNQAPIAEAGLNRTVQYNTDTDGHGSTILYGNISSDPDGDALTYLWTLENAPVGIATLNDPTLVSASVDIDDPTGVNNGVVFTVRLRVTDPLGLYDEDTFEITLENIGTPQ